MGELRKEIEDNNEIIMEIKIILEVIRSRVYDE